MRAGEVGIRAPAKINVGLAVLGPRGDGYHEVLTLYQTVSLYDRLALRKRRRGIGVFCPALPGLGRDNLAHRAAELFLSRAGVAGGVAVDLWKGIPAGGGLGGGSSDAAAVLVGCCRLFGRSPGEERLREWAAELGSDVPFFVRGGAAVGTGRGERIEPLPPWAGAGTAVLYLPPEGLSTAAVYRRAASSGLTEGRRAFTILLERWREGELRGLGAALFNDLEPAAFALMPALKAVKAAFLELGAAGAVLCGSGSSVVALFAEAGAAGLAARRLRGRFPGVVVRVEFLRERRRWGVVKR